MPHHAAFAGLPQHIVIEVEPKHPVFGDTVILTLYPPLAHNLSFEWMRGADVVQGADYSGIGCSVLSVNGLKAEHEGQYVCKISGDNFQTESEPIQLKGTHVAVCP